MKQLFRQYGRPALQQVDEQVGEQWVIPAPARTQQVILAKQDEKPTI